MFAIAELEIKPDKCSSGAVIDKVPRHFHVNNNSISTGEMYQNILGASLGLKDLLPDYKFLKLLKEHWVLDIVLVSMVCASICSVYINNLPFADGAVKPIDRGLDFR